MTENDGLLGKEWCWRDVSNEELTESQKQRMQNIFKERIIMVSLKQDKIIWCCSLLGNYLVKLGYNMLAETNEEIFTSKDLCQDKDILPKAGAFAWLAYNERILTMERLKSIGINGPSRCPLCEKNEETIDHLLVQCQYAKKWWDMM